MKTKRHETSIQTSNIKLFGGKMNKSSHTINTNAASYLAKIVESAIRLEYSSGFKSDMKLQRENRLKTIHSSLAIEGNSLSLSEVAAIIDGKYVAGKQSEIKEVKNAYKAYDKIMTFDPYSVRDFLKAHKLMMNGLIEESGKFRSGDVGVFDGRRAIHIGARPQFVAGLIEDLFAWAKTSELHPALKSAILHYEIEIIHPFADGNGRMGRFWQTLLLAKWNAIFTWMPMESLVYERRPQYYQAIAEASRANDSGAFIEFALWAISDIMDEQEKHKDKHKDKHEEKHEDKHEDKHKEKHEDKHKEKHKEKHEDKHEDKHEYKHKEKHKEKHEDKHKVELTKIQIAALKSLKNKALSRKEIFEAIKMSGDTRAFNRHIEPLLTIKFIEMTEPDNPNSRLQKYRLTDRGRRQFDGQCLIN
jgi:Fic family protein